MSTRPNSLDDAVGEGLDLASRCDVEVLRVRGVALLADEADGLRGALVVDVGEDHGDTGLGIADADGLAQAAAAAGDDRDPSGDVEEVGHEVGRDGQPVVVRVGHRSAPGSLGWSASGWTSTSR